MQFNVTTVRPEGFIHSSAFIEVVDSLAWALTSLGHQANVTQSWFAPERNIIFGTELLSPAQQLPQGSIIYNLEQPTHPNMGKIRKLAQGHTVWDYSLTNVKKWRELGYNVKHVPIGYTPNLTRIPKGPVQEIDVLFVGWLTPRRMEVIKNLKAAGLNVVATDKCYGGGRDNLISRSKVVLNVHHDGRDLFEIVRVSYLLANSKCVVSEFSADDLDYSDISNGFIKAKYEGLVEACQQILKFPAREKLAAHGFELIKRRDYVHSVKAALADPTPQEKVAARYVAGCQAGDMKDFMEWIKQHAKGTCLEIGTRDGASTAALLRGVEENGGVVCSIDIEDCGHLFNGHPQWKFVRSSSQNKALKLAPLDLAFVDGDHSREGYRADLELVYPLVKPGGLILSHDIHPEPGHEFYMVGLREEFFKFAKEKGLEHFELPGYAGLGVMKKVA